jgi:beta-lactamase class D
MPKKSLAVLIPLLLPLLLGAAPRPAPLPADTGQRVSRVLAGTPSAFVLYDGAHDRFVRFDEERCRRRFTPFSTFKIPNAAIGLETGVIQDPDAVVPWDQKKHPPESHWPEGWKRDHSLRSALKASAVWFFQDMAVRIGPERMAKLLRQLDYGNQEISGGIDHFWLASTLKISADEQVRFLRSFYDGKLGLSPRTTATVKDILVQEKTPAYTLSAKTGGGPTGPGKALGWFVGYVETRGNVYFFALNLDGPSYTAIKDKRIDLAKAALRAARVLPTG